MNKNKKLFLWMGGLFLFLLISIVISLRIGSVGVTIHTIYRILVSHLFSIPLEVDWSTGQEAIIWNLRLPRILLAMVVGGMLSLAGVAFQGILQNPLADPYILGVSSGAALGAAISILLQTQRLFILSTSISAFIGAMASLGFVLWLANLQSRQKNEALILAGVVVQSLIGALLTFAIALSGEQMQTIIFWMMGSLANKEWLDIGILLPYFIFGFAFLWTQHKEFNVMALGERAAIHLGVDVNKKKWMILLVASLLTATAVSIVGIIGFVGLVIPHMLRILTGPDHRILIPVSTIAGAIFLLWADTIARSILPGREIPIGVVTALIGAPFFAYLLRQGLRRKSL